MAKGLYRMSDDEYGKRRRIGTPACAVQRVQSKRIEDRRRQTRPHATLCVEVQLQTGARPSRLIKATRARRCNPCIPHIVAAEAHVGNKQIGNGKVLDRSVRREGGNSAVHHRSHLDRA